MWTPRTQQKDQIDILEMKETCLLISNRTFSTGLTLATYNTTAVAYFKGQSLLFRGPLLKVQITMSHRPWNWGEKNNNFKLLMDYVAANDRRFKKREKEETDAFSEWVKTVSSLIEIWISKLKKSMGTKVIFVLNDPDVAAILISNMLLFLQISPLTTLVLSAKTNKQIFFLTF